jgi:hypothetical protein
MTKKEEEEKRKKQNKTRAKSSQPTTSQPHPFKQFSHLVYGLHPRDLFDTVYDLVNVLYTVLLFPKSAEAIV